MKSEFGVFAAPLCRHGKVGARIGFAARQIGSHVAEEDFSARAAKLCRVDCLFFAEIEQSFYGVRERRRRRLQLVVISNARAILARRFVCAGCPGIGRQERADQKRESRETTVLILSSSLISSARSARPSAPASARASTNPPHAGRCSLRSARNLAARNGERSRFRQTSCGGVYYSRAR